MHHTNKKRRSNLKTGIKYIELFLPPSIAYVSILSFQKYVCDKCGKQFKEKRSLTRHMNTHVDFSQTYPCNVCGKEFKSADHRKRHEKSHNYTITCPVCGRYFNRRESMLRHRALHERPEVRPTMKRPPSSGPSNSPPKQPRSQSPVFQQSVRPSTIYPR